MKGASVAFQGLAKRYGGVVALEPTDLAIAPGEFFALLGPSGSGKSTLLGTVAGFVPPSEGTVLVDGIDITGVPPHRRNIGMVFQNYSLFPFLTVFRNIAFPLEMRRIPKAKITERVERMLAMVRLSHAAERLPNQLSGGQQQRVALARAAVYDPPLLLMDEPLGALDKNLREEMQEEIKQFHRQVGATVLYVTHDQQEAAALADRIAILNRGRLEQCGDPRALYTAPRNVFVASFLGEANMFRVMGRANGFGRIVTREHVELAVASGSEAPGDIVACVRPESIEIVTAPSQRANQVAGTVADVVHAGGSIRYRVRISDGCVMTVRVPSERRATPFEIGAPAYLGWDAEDTLLIPA